MCTPDVVPSLLGCRPDVPEWFARACSDADEILGANGLRADQPGLGRGHRNARTERVQLGALSAVAGRSTEDDEDAHGNAAAIPLSPAAFPLEPVELIHARRLLAMREREKRAQESAFYDFGPLAAARAEVQRLERLHLQRKAGA